MIISTLLGKLPEGKKVIININFSILPKGAILTTAKTFCSVKSKRDHKLLMIERCIEIGPVVLEL